MYVFREMFGFTATEMSFMVFLVISLYSAMFIFTQDVDITACTSGRGQLVIGGKFHCFEAW